MSPSMMAPVLSAGIWPDTKTRPAALMACDCVEARTKEGKGPIVRKYCAGKGEREGIEGST